MKQLVILSGKGGTGKTSVAAAFAHLAAEGEPPCALCWPMRTWTRPTWSWCWPRSRWRRTSLSAGRWP